MIASCSPWEQLTRNSVRPSADFQAEEVEHRDAALKAGAERAPAYPLLSGLIRLGCRAAIALSEKI